MFRIFKDKVANFIQGKGPSKYDFDDLSIESLSTCDDEMKNEDDDFVSSQTRRKTSRTKAHGLSIFKSINKFSSQTNKMNIDISETIKNNVPFSNDSIISVSPRKRKREEKAKFDIDNKNNDEKDENSAYQLNNDDSRFDTIRTQSNKVSTRLNDKIPPDIIKNETNYIYDENLSSIDMLFSKVRHNHYGLVKSVLENKTAHNEDFNKISIDSNGNTLLHICCQNNLKKMAVLIIQCGVFVNQKNKKGLTALDYCDMYKFHALGDYVTEHGGGEVGIELNKPSEISFRY